MSQDQDFSQAEVDRQQSLFDHLSELRTRLMQSAFFVIIATFVCFHYAGNIFDYLRMPIQQYLPSGGLIYTGPIDKFMAFIKIAITSGVIISCPFWLWQIWKFVAPGLYKREQKYAISFITFGTVLFLTGVAFAYFVVLPMAFKFLMTFGGEVDKPMIAIDSYLSFVTQITLMFGLSFELPLIISILGMLGLVSQRFLREKRRFAVMILAVISAIVTPPDLLSMLLMLGPMWLLYELSIIIVFFVEKKRKETNSEI